MKNLRFPIALATGAVIAGVTLAHHNPVPLSFEAGAQILDEVTVYLRPTDFGVPAYSVGSHEHGHLVNLAAGDSFTVSDNLGNSQTVVFDPAAFVDIANATDHEVADAINAQISIAAVSRTNGYFAFRGLFGGPGGQLTLQEVSGTPLQAMHVQNGTSVGRDEVELSLSIPPGGGLENQRYVLLASATPGQFTRKGQTFPFAFDSTTRMFLTAALQGSIQGFRGRLDSNADASAVVSAAVLEQLFGVGNVPSELYFAYVVLPDGPGDFEFVSNAFTVHVVQ